LASSMLKTTLPACPIIEKLILMIDLPFNIICIVLLIVYG
jgi:hypothetical protein